MYIYRANDAPLAFGQLFRKRSLETIYSVIKLLPSKKNISKHKKCPIWQDIPFKVF